MFRGLRLGKREGKDHESSRQFGSTVGRRDFSYSQLLKITNNFEQIIGRGGLATLYHGYVDNLQVVVKMLTSSDYNSRFQIELEVLQRIHHVNLINIIGYCKEDKHPAIVIGYMTNGDLGKYLSDDSPLVLAWKIRLRIAMEVAQGLEYLHDFCEPPIVHRNVKTRTILLSDNFKAKLGGFCLARPMASDDSSHESTGVAGTLGYLDPEYYMSGRVTLKSDVFSFGVVLLTMISGREAILRDPENNNIIGWVNSMLEHGGVSDIIDPRLNAEYEIESVKKAVKLARACVSETSRARPTTNQVVSGLKKCLAIELGSSTDSIDIV